MVESLDVTLGFAAVCFTRVLVGADIFFDVEDSLEEICFPSCGVLPEIIFFRSSAAMSFSVLGPLVSLKTEVSSVSRINLVTS